MPDHYRAPWSRELPALDEEHEERAQWRAAVETGRGIAGGGRR